MTAVTWVTNKFPGRAPEDVALVRGFVGRAGREQVVDLPDTELIRLIREELHQVLGIAAEPIDANVYRWRDALPQYVLGHTERLAQIDERMRGLPGIHLTGAAYRGVGIPDCIQSGQSAATHVLEGLGAAQSGDVSASAAIR